MIKAFPLKLHLGWAILTKGSSVKLVIGITLSAPNSSSFKSEQDVLKRQAQMALNQANGLIIYKYAELYGSSDFYVNEDTGNETNNKRMIFMKKIISIITILAFSLNSLFVMAENETAESSSQQEAQQEAQQSSDQENTSRDEIEPNITLIDDLKAVNLTAGIDFAISGDTEAIKKELETAFSQIEEIELNTVILSSTYEGKAYFSLEGESDPLFLANKMAREKGFSTFIRLDIDFLINDALKSDNIQDNYILSINKFASKYIADGIILTNYYTKNDTDAFNYYKRRLWYWIKNWLYENNEYFVKTASEIIRTTNNAIAIGL